MGDVLLSPFCVSAWGRRPHARLRGGRARSAERRSTFSNASETVLASWVMEQLRFLDALVSDSPSGRQQSRLSNGMERPFPDFSTD